ncbi:MAG: TonB-dependent receptor [Bacteroidetes bacterium]|jgi:hypothetical protein|nr:TonB-dependent receptor [Bacteroidota bacterium]
MFIIKTLFPNSLNAFNFIIKNILIVCFLFFCIPLLPAQQSQDIQIKGSFQDKSLSIVLLELKISHRLQFEYDETLVEGIRVTTSFRKASLDYAMKKILEGTEIDFEITAPRSIRLFHKSQKPKVDWSKIKPTRENFNVSGVVKDKKTGETLPFATLITKENNNGVTTNIDGYFTLFDVPSDTSVLVVNYIGYQNKFVRLTPETDVSQLEILLEDFGVQLEEVVVKATKEEQLLSASTGISRIGITPAALAKLPSFGEKDIFRSMQLLPGVSGSNESSSGLYVRGGTPDQNLVLFDGFTVYHVDHLFGFFSAFNANAVKDVQLYKGGFDAKYGGRLSSVVELTGKEGNRKEFNMGIGLSLLSVNGFVEAPFANGKGSFLVAGRRSFQSSFYNNIFDAYTDSNEAASTETARRVAQLETQPNTFFYDLNVKATYRPNSKDVFSFSFYNGQDNLDNSSSLDESVFTNRGLNVGFTFDRINTDLTKWGNWGASTKWSRRWSNQLYSNANLSYSNYFSQRDRSSETSIGRSDTTFVRSNGSMEENDLKDITFKLDNEFKISQNNQLDFGIQTIWNNIDYQFVQNDTTTIIDRNDEGLTATFYVQDKHTVGEKFILKGGLRTSYYSPTNEFYLEPRAALTYLLSDKIKLKAAWGKYHQFANRIVREDIQQGSRDFWLLADDEQVPISSSIHNIAGISYETSNWLFDVEAYYKTLDGLSEYSTRFVPSGFGSNQTIAFEEFFHTGTGIAKGIEFLIQRKVGKFTGWAGYTLGEVKYDFDAFGDEPFFANQDVTHELKLIGNYKLGSFSLAATFVYATGKPYTAPTGYYELQLLDGTTSNFFEISDKNAVRFDDYHRLDLSGTYDFTKVSVGLSLTNIYNRKNTWYNEYDVIEGELLETKVSLLGFTPSLFFTWSFR